MKSTLLYRKKYGLEEGFFAVIYAGLGQMPFTLGFPRECISIGIISMSQDKRGFKRTEHIKCEKSGMA